MTSLALQNRNQMANLGIEYLARHVCDVSPSGLLELTLEDVALVQAWFQSGNHDAYAIETFSKLPARIAQWLDQKVPPERVTEGARQQPILRRCIDALDRQGPAGLRRDELNFLFTVHDLIQRSRLPEQFKRPFTCIAPQLDAIQRRRSNLPEVLGLPSLLEQVMLATEATIREAPIRDIRVFGGIRERFRGPMLIHTGTLKIVGDIPDDTAVVVEGGSCYVSGYVLGRLLVEDHAEVQENIGGLLIAQRGNVRVRAIVNHATVIAKIGRIACGSAQSPALVYAGAQLRIRQSATLGTYIAPQIRVDSAINGGTWHTTSSLKAENLVHTVQRPVDIVLRKNIGHEDFGESLPSEAVVLLQRGGRLQSRIAYLLQLKKRQAEEAEHYASTALFYICSIGDCQEDLYELDALKRRRSFILRLMMGVHMLTRSLMSILQAPKAGRAADSDPHLSVQFAIRQCLGEVTRELAELKLEGGYPEDLDTEWQDLILVHTQSAGTGADGGLAKAILRFDQSRRAWKEQVHLLNEKIDSLQLRLAGDTSRKALLDLVQAAGASQPVLLQLVRVARQRGVKDQVVRRMATPFVRRMLDLLKKRNDWAFRYGADAAKQASEQAALQKILRETYGIESVVQKQSPRVEGVFQGGVRLHIEELSNTLDAGNDKCLVAAQDQTGAIDTYTIREETIVRLPRPVVTVQTA